MIKETRVGAGTYVIVQQVDTDQQFGKKQGFYVERNNELMYIYKYPKKVKAQNGYKYIRGVLLGHIGEEQNGN